jgi:putative CocE/NonD family hydrolase
MRDGVCLAADVYLPPGQGRWPTVLVRTPYNRTGGSKNSYRFFVRYGFALVMEDVRGRYASQGTFTSVEQEGPDGNDSINWIAQQPWSDGRVVMAGSSYVGMTQWWAALQDNPHLFAIAPASSGDDEYLDMFYSPGGAFKLGHRLLWVSQNLTPRGHPRPALNDYIRHVPLITADVVATGLEIPIWREILAHPSYDRFWEKRSVREEISRIRIPVLSFGGWFDNYGESDLDAFSRLAAEGTPVETWMGPWSHNPGYKFPLISFGASANLSIRDKQLEWFEKWLNREPQESTPRRRALLHVFVMGPDIWREEHEWPLARTKYTKLFLASQGHANSKQGNGQLAWQGGGPSNPDTFIYDPNNPVPTTGGAICCDPRLLPPGPLNQSQLENRSDILVYTSPPLSESTEVTGPIHVVLYVATSANDTDFTAKLVDVDTHGAALLVADGIQRLRFRLSLDKPVFVKRNSRYQITIDAGVTSYVFERRHRIRLEISSSNFPRFDRNLNSTRANAYETKMTKAKQTVLHGPRYPSAIILPVIPEERQTSREQ